MDMVRKGNTVYPHTRETLRPIHSPHFISQVEANFFGVVLHVSVYPLTGYSKDCVFSRYAMRFPACLHLHSTSSCCCIFFSSSRHVNFRVFHSPIPRTWKSNFTMTFYTMVEKSWKRSSHSHLVAWVVIFCSFLRCFEMTLTCCFFPRYFGCFNAFWNRVVIDVFQRKRKTEKEVTTRILNDYSFW